MYCEYHTVLRFEDNAYMLCSCRSMASKHFTVLYRLRTVNQLLVQLQSPFHWTKGLEIRTIRLLFHCQLNQVLMIRGKLDSWSGQNFVLLRGRSRHWLKDTYHVLIWKLWRMELYLACLKVYSCNVILIHCLHCGRLNISLYLLYSVLSVVEKCVLVC